MPGSSFTLRREEAAFLRALVRNEVDFMIVGVMAAVIQGAPAVTQDIDLWFRDLSDPGVVRALKAVGGAYVPPTAYTPPMFAGSAVELFDIVLRLDGLRSFAFEARTAVPIAIAPRLRVKVLPLRRVIASKRAADRPKDRVVLAVLEDTLKSAEEKQRKSGRR